MLREIDLNADNLVKAGEPLEFGKMVLCIQEKYTSDNSETKKLLMQIKKAVAERGYEIVDPDTTFQSRCFYDKEDERTQDFLKKGQVYQCLNLMNWRAPMLQYEQWYVRKGDKGVNMGKNGIPYPVTEILNSIKDNERTLQSSLAVAGAEALKECTPSEEPLSENERVMLLTCMFNCNFTLANMVGMVTSQSTNPINLRIFVKEHPEKWAMMMRAWMFQQIHGSHANLCSAESMLDELGAKNCPELFQQKRDKAQAKFDKNKAKAEKKLRDLGYGLDGKPLVVTKKVTMPKIDSKTIKKQFKEMKAKHPDAILLFRVGDFYQLFNEDAEAAAPILKLNLAPWHVDATLNQCGFVHHALNKYLPKLVRAGKRVAICEQLEEPKKKSNKGKIRISLKSHNQLKCGATQ